MLSLTVPSTFIRIFVTIVLAFVTTTTTDVSAFTINQSSRTTSPFNGVRSQTSTTITDNKSNMDSAFVSRQSWRMAAPTVEAPTREKTDRKTGKRNGRDSSYDDDDDESKWDYPDMEYLMDPYALRGDEDPFHILLLGSTFEKPKVTVLYVSNSLEYVLGMPLAEAKELSQFARDEGMSCLGTWPREKCLTFGKQLQVRDIVCRVVPYCEGGQRGWQAKDAASSGAGSSNNGASYN